MKNKIILGIIIKMLLLIAFIQVNAQDKVKYKDLFEEISNAPTEIAFSKLMQYQRQDPTNDNAYYQLGLISAEWSKQYNPITEYAQIKYFTYNTNLYFGLAKFNFDEKDARKNRDYYTLVQPAEGERKVQYADILADMEARIDQNSDFEKQIDTIKLYYDATVKFYNNCIENYKTIVGKYQQQKDLYLMADNDLFSTIEQIGNDFDSAMIYFNKFQKSTARYPVFSYEQKIEFKPIDTYRLQGLTTSDFRKEMIPVWDYGLWHKNILSIFTNEITELRNIIEETNRQFDRSSDYLIKTDQFEAEPAIFRLDHRTTNLIKKYDNQSIIPILFESRQAKLNFLSLTRHPLNNINESEESSLLKHARFYSDLVNAKLKSDSLNQKLRNQISPESGNKYKQFISESYKNIEGLQEFSKQEETNNTTILNESINNMKVFVIKHLNRYKTNAYAVKYDSLIIPVLAAVPPLRDTSKNHYHTVVIEANPYGGIYAAGYFNNKDKKREAFIAKISNDRKAIWVRRFAFKSADNEALNNIGMLLQVADSSCYLLINAKKSFGSQMENFLIKLDADGNEQISLRLEATQMPRYMRFDDINERLLMAFKGIRYDPLAPDLGKLTIDFADPNGVKIWSQEMQMVGSLIDIVKMNRNFLVFCNFNQYISDKDGMVKAKCEDSRSKTNIFVSILDQSGAILNNHSYFSENPFFGLRAIKVDSETINIVGLQGEINIQNSEEFNPASEFFYMLTNKQGEIIYSNMKAIEN